VDTQLLDEAKAAGYSTKVLFIFPEDANLNVGRVLVRTESGGQAVPISSVIGSYGSRQRIFPRSRNTRMINSCTTTRRIACYKVVAEFIGGELSRTAQNDHPGLAARVFGSKDLPRAKAQRETQAGGADFFPRFHSAGENVVHRVAVI